MDGIHEVLFKNFLYLLLEELLKKYCCLTHKGVIIGQENLMLPNTLV